MFTKRTELPALLHCC